MCRLPRGRSRSLALRAERPRNGNSTWSSHPGFRDRKRHGSCCRRIKSRGTVKSSRLYPKLAPLPVEPKPQPGPGGKPYTLEELQRLAAANNPTLVQAASDVQAAQGNLIQAKTYPNPILSYLQDTSNNNNIAGVQGGTIDQTIITGGKMKLGVAAAQKNLDNAVLALKRTRMDLATSVRNAYFTVLVNVETLIVTRAAGAAQRRDLSTPGRPGEGRQPAGRSLPAYGTPGADPAQPPGVQAGDPVLRHGLEGAGGDARPATSSRSRSSPARSIASSRITTTTRSAPMLCETTPMS